MSSLQLQIENRQTLAVDLEALRDQMDTVLRAAGYSSGSLQIVLVDDAEIHAINRDFLEHDWPTDVITFSYADELPDQPQALDGELVVSVETADRMAVEHGCSRHAELLLYCVHGVLHLCGYDDTTASERVRMRQREQELLAIFGVVPQGTEYENRTLEL